MSDRPVSGAGPEGVHPIGLTILLDGAPFGQDTTNARPSSNLQISVSPEIAPERARFFVVKTPLVQYVPDFQDIQARDGEVVDLGQVDGLMEQENRSLTTVLEPDSIYDIFYICDRMLTPYRLTTSDEPRPSRLTLDEIKIMLAIMTDMNLGDLNGVKATVIAGALHLRNRSQFFAYGFRIGSLNITVSTLDEHSIFFTDSSDILRLVSNEDMRAHLEQAPRS
ncbi:hypothetical protein HY024_04745 [Candidatus Curtissbacteria bacterium]|nr:hypothetical protein [Candidatus Curtissbacteria bacterium]